jgi:hypothetical protein
MKIIKMNLTLLKYYLIVLFRPLIPLNNYLAKIILIILWLKYYLRLTVKLTNKKY